MTSLPQNPAAAYTPPPYRSARIFATWAIGGLLLTLGCSIYQLIFEIEGIRLLDGIFAGQEVSEQELLAYDARSTEIAIVSLAAMGLAITMFCIWLYRVSRNIMAIGRPLKASPGWAVGSFFIPILNLWRPYEAINNVWEMSDPDLRPDRPTAGKTFVLLWWVAWVMSRFAGLGMSWEVETEAQLRKLEVRVYLWSVLVVVAGTMAMVLIHRLTRRQEVFAERYMVPAAQVVRD